MPSPYFNHSGAENEFNHVSGARWTPRKGALGGRRGTGWNALSPCADVPTQPALERCSLVLRFLSSWLIQWPWESSQSPGPFVSRSAVTELIIPSTLFMKERKLTGVLTVYSYLGETRILAPAQVRWGGGSTITALWIETGKNNCGGKEHTVAEMGFSQEAMCFLESHFC